MESIEHFSHPHLLTRCLVKDNEEVKCFACTKRCLNQYYSCDECQYFLHEECANLPMEIKMHPLHTDHTLILGPTAHYIGIVYCDACDNRCRGFTFRCEECKFDLDIDCAIKLSREGGGPLLIKHFSHYHFLVLREKIHEDKRAQCEACDKRCLRDTYTCSSCKFFLHKSCAELNMELRHWLHKAHVLKLRTSSNVYDGRAWCDSCGRRVRGFVYHCEICQFDLDIVCSRQSAPTSKPGDQEHEKHHFSHEHLLTIREEEKRDVVLICAACGDDCSSSRIYGCEECEYFLHESCAKLPLTMEHLYHAEHPLKLQVATYNYCDLCEKLIKGFTYHCDQCNFDLDIGCAWMPSIEPGTTNTEMKKQFFGHDHGLTISVKKEEEGVACSACEKQCSGLIYACDDCGFFLHIGCAELPQERQHFFHPLHKLTLQRCDSEVCCNACEKKCRGFTFSCRECKFHLDVDCAMRVVEEIHHFGHRHSLKPTILKSNHELTRSVKKEEEGVACSACEKQCSGLIYACDDCGFFLHKGCAELPQECQHFFHPLHKLTLQRLDSEVSCNACEKQCCGFTFSCRECKFHLDVDCAMRVGEIHHFGHRHSLKPTKLESNSKCSACNQSFLELSQIYGCLDCKYFLHESCAKLPLEKTHPYHQRYPLKLQVASYNYCDFCGEKIEGFVYRCDRCDFNLDMKCVEMPSISSKMKKKVEEMKIKSFAHHHELTGSMKSKVDKVVCSACKKKCTGLTYACGCKGCSFYLHKGCAELPGEYEHFAHPSHRLHLQNSDSKLFCGACKVNIHGFTFSCKECNFHLDVVCAMMAEKLKHGDYIHHLSHGHPLMRTKKELKGRCLACNQSRSDSGEIYGCGYCSLWLHISCTELPLKLEHFLHDFHKRDSERDCELTLEARIALTGGQGKLCGACQNACRGSVIYQCKLCDLNLDVECALLPSRNQEGTLAKNFPAVHGHPLQLSSIEKDTKSRLCAVCAKRCTDPTYQCIKCETFTVHESCAELPPRIPRRSRHCHEMDLLKKSRFTCAACLNLSSGFTYDCDICSPPFSLHIGCKNFKPIIKCGHLDHYLHFLDNIHKEVACRNCDGDIFSCSSKEMEVETENKQGLFRCVTCNYSLHLLCGPLPCLIKSDNHRHVLQLEDKFVEDDSGEYYCDACEKRRDPDKCVYKCSQENCPYVTHFECMKPEVLRLLKGEQKEEVELKFLGSERIYRKVIEVQDMTEMALKNEGPDRSRQQDIQTLEDLLVAFIQDEQTKLPGTFQILKKETVGTGHASFWELLEGSGSTADVSPYSQQTLTQFLDRIEPRIDNLEFSAIFFEGEELVEVDRYRVNGSLAPTLRLLLEKRGDISTGSKLKLKSKSLIFNLLCGAIRSMSATPVNELTETLLHDWWNQVMMAKHAGFEIQFALHRLEEIFRAHFALRAEEIQNHRLLELEDQIRACKNQAAKAEELTRISRQYEESAEASLRQGLLGKVKALEGETVGRGLL